MGGSMSLQALMAEIESIKAENHKMSEALALQAADHDNMAEASLSLDELLKKINSNSE